MYLVVWVGFCSMVSETEFIVRSSGRGGSVPMGEYELWFEVLHGEEAGNRIKVSYAQADSGVQEVLESASEGDVVTAKIVDELEGWRVIDVEAVG